MSKLSKEELARFSGADWALRMCEEYGVEECRKELERRNILSIPLKISKKDIDEAVLKIKHNCMTTVLLMACATLRDEYGFGYERMTRFINRFNTKAECLVDKFVYWKELQQCIKDETGIFIDLPDEFMIEEE